MSKQHELTKRKLPESVTNYFHINWGILIGFFILFIFLTIFADNFFTYGNLLNVLRAVSTNSFLAMGVMMAIMLAGIDLTGGAIIALSGCVSVSLLKLGINIPIAVVTGMLVGTAFGLLNGLVIAYTGIHPFVVTLATQSICRGMAYLIANGKPIAIMNDEYTKLGNGYIFGAVPLPAVYMIVFLFFTYVLLNRTRFGRHIYAVGGNPIAAKYSGINIKKIQIIVWTMSGFLASFGGVILSSRMSSGQPAVGIGFETDAIAAAVLGGTSFFGGTGSVGGLIIGVLIIGTISNGLNLLHVNSYWQYVAKGTIILLSVYFDIYRKNKEDIRRSKIK